MTPAGYCAKSPSQRLTVRELEVVSYLNAQPEGRAKLGEITAALWGWDAASHRRNLNGIVYRLRKKCGAEAILRTLNFALRLWHLPFWAVEALNAHDEGKAPRIMTVYPLEKRTKSRG